MLRRARRKGPTRAKAPEGLIIARRNRDCKVEGIPREMKERGSIRDVTEHDSEVEGLEK